MVGPTGPGILGGLGFHHHSRSGRYGCRRAATRRKAAPLPQRSPGSAQRLREACASRGLGSATLTSEEYAAASDNLRRSIRGNAGPCMATLRRRARLRLFPGPNSDGGLAAFALARFLRRRSRPTEDEIMSSFDFGAKPARPNVIPTAARNSGPSYQAGFGHLQSRPRARRMHGTQRVPKWCKAVP